jgi:hypothetical protein
MVESIDLHSATASAQQIKRERIWIGKREHRDGESTRALKTTGRNITAAASGEVAKEHSQD